jgi:hypothetical protein
MAGVRSVEGGGVTEYAGFYNKVSQNRYSCLNSKNYGNFQIVVPAGGVLSYQMTEAVAQTGGV